MYIKKAHAKLLEIPLNAYTLLVFAISVMIMLFFGYDNAKPDVVVICVLLAIGAFGEFIYLMMRRDKALRIIAKRRMHAIQRKRLKRAKQSLMSQVNS